jgi:selenide, water dikinase
MTGSVIRLTQTAAGGGCSCKISPGVLESMLRDLDSSTPSEVPFERTDGLTAGMELLCGSEKGDDAAVVRISGNRALLMTADFFPPVVDDAYDWGRIAAANALSDIYAMGGEPVVAVNLLAWPVDSLSRDLAVATLEGGRAVTTDASCFLAGGHSIVDESPKYGLAVTGLADPSRLLRNDAGRPGDALSLTKPLGLGTLNNRHKITGERFDEAIAVMVKLNRDASRAAISVGASAATDVTGFGLLGHAFKLARASGVSAVINASAVPYIEGARESLYSGYIPGGTRRNLEWVRPALTASADESELLLLADAQTSGGLLIAGEIPGAPVIGELIERGDAQLIVR